MKTRFTQSGVDEHSENAMNICPRCGKTTFRNVCKECTRAGEPEARPAFSGVALTTAPSLEGHSIVRTVDVIGAECALGVSSVKDLVAGWDDRLGDRSGTLQSIVKKARQICLIDLRREAHAVGANAVIAVSLSYKEFNGGGKTAIVVIASGTAVIASSEIDELGAEGIA